jgi:hypothetical protein
MGRITSLSPSRRVALGTVERQRPSRGNLDVVRVKKRNDQQVREKGRMVELAT